MNNPIPRYVFLRGLTRGTIHWGDFPEVFKTMYPQAELDFLEIPGNGELYQEATPIGASEVVEHLSNRCRFVKANQSYHLVGISLGGMMALKWAEFLPEQVLSVTVINCSLPQFSTFYERLRPEYYFKILKGLFFSGHFVQEQLILNITSNHPENYEKYLGLFSEFSKNHPVSKMNFFRQLLLAKNVMIHSLNSVPVKVICSKEDRLVNWKCSQAIAKELNAQLIVHPTAGHDLPLDEPEWLAGQCFS